MVGIAVQVSLYPLRQETLSPAIDEALQVFRAHDLDVDPGAMSTMIAGDDEEHILVVFIFGENFHPPVTPLVDGI